MYKLNITFVKNPNRWEANQLAKQDYCETHPSGQNSTWTRDLQITSPAPKPEGDAASTEQFGHNLRLGREKKLTDFRRWTILLCFFLKEIAQMS